MLKIIVIPVHVFSRDQKIRANNKPRLWEYKFNRNNSVLTLSLA